jgi:hypothetical protein
MCKIDGIHSPYLARLLAASRWPLELSGLLFILTMATTQLILRVLLFLDALVDFRDQLMWLQQGFSPFNLRVSGLFLSC